MATSGFGTTDTGRSREGNEDNLFVDDGLGLYVVCDGMGGHAAGEVASQLAVETVREVVKHRPGKDLETTVRAAIAEACRMVYETATSTPEHAGMGCTITMLLTSGARAVMGHVGDTRLYLLRDGQVHQLSSDHTMAMHLARIGAIKMEEVPEHPYAHVLTHAVGTQPAVQAEVLAMDLLPGDRYLLCSDGLSDYFRSPHQVRTILATPDAAAAPRSFVDFANDVGGEDNITAVVVDVPRLAPEQAEQARRAQEHIDALAKAPFFNEDFLAQLVRLAGVSQVRVFGEGEVVLREGERCAALYVPLGGELTVRSGERAETVRPGDVVGESTLLHPRPCRATLVGKAPGRVLVLPADQFSEMLRRYPGFGIGVLERLGEHLSRRLDDLGSQVADRVVL